MALTGKKAGQLSAATIAAFKNVFGIGTIESRIGVNETNINNVNSQINDTSYSSVTIGRSLSISSTLLKSGRTIRFKTTGATTGSNISVFLYRADNTYILIYNGNTDNYNTYRLTEDFASLRFYNNTDGLGYTGTLIIKCSVVNQAMRLLVLGTSYSASGSQWIPKMLEQLPSGSSYISLAVGSATIRDKQSDRTTYPYTSRPVSTNNAGNLNTLSCQIEKLKRLMAGTDLDGGESKIYETSSSSPNVIIIEGGMNDTFDSDALQQTYTAQFSKQLTNVYRKAYADASPVLGAIYTKTPIAEVNRTCFAGAYRYLVEELLKLFPEAQIFITTASRLGYWTYDVNDVRSKTAAQQRICAELCGVNVIDWNKDAQINSIVNYPAGSGTEQDPYIYDRSVGSVDSNDAMHPTVKGGTKLGRLSALVIKRNFFNLLNE